MKGLFVPKEKQEIKISILNRVKRFPPTITLQDTTGLTKDPEEVVVSFNRNYNTPFLSHKIEEQKEQLIESRSIK